jgi:ATP/maltotriose-dependent transcriptional regulator MalT
MNNLVVKSKFIPPKFYKKGWKNKKLCLKYKKIKSYPLTLLKSPVGYGKTTSIVDFFQKNYPEDFYWYSLREEDIDKNTFWTSFVNAFSLKNKELKKEVSSFLDKFDEDNMDKKEFLKNLSNFILDYFNKDTFLIIDNFHLISKNEFLLEFFSYFIDLIPPLMHVVIISRNDINFAKLSSWKLNSKILIIEEDFILKQHQIEEFFLSKYNLRVSSSILRKIKKLTEGWIMAVDLIANELLKKNNLKEVLKNKDDTFALLFAYLNDEILENINKIMWESHMIKDKQFGRQEGFKIMKELEEWASNK